VQPAPAKVGDAGKKIKMRMAKDQFAVLFGERFIKAMAA
jgi:hypothetical protein